MIIREEKLSDVNELTGRKWILQPSFHVDLENMSSE
jgi:hypothetical protein